MKISEVQITPVKPHNGIVAFCSFVLDDSLYLGSIALMTRPDGALRLCYPTKKVGSQNINIFYPIQYKVGALILSAMLTEYEKLTSKKGEYYE